MSENNNARAASFELSLIVKPLLLFGWVVLYLHFMRMSEKGMHTVYTSSQIQSLCNCQQIHKRLRYLKEKKEKILHASKARLIRVLPFKRSSMELRASTDVACY